MTAPLPLGLAEQIEALKAEMRLDIDDPTSPLAFARRLTNELLDLGINRTLALCAEAWGTREAERHNSDVATIRALAACQTKVNAQAARIAELEAHLREYEECAMYDALMEGPIFKGWNRSALDRARKNTEARLALKEPS